MMMHGSGGRSTSTWTCLALRVVRHQGHALAHDGMDIKWLRVQLTVPEHRPVPLDDL